MGIDDRDDEPKARLIFDTITPGCEPLMERRLREEDQTAYGETFLERLADAWSKMHHPLMFEIWESRHCHRAGVPWE